MRYRIHGTVMQAVSFELKEGQSIYSESGRMAWMSDNIRIKTSAKGSIMEGVKRRLAGESIFLTTFTCGKGSGLITFTSEFPGKIMPIKFEDEREIICQKDAFLCAEETVKLEMYFRRRMGAGFFGGEGFILQKLSGKGMAFVEVAGEILEFNLKDGQQLLVDTGHIAMYEPSIDFDIVPLTGWKNILFGGEGIFLAKLVGPGKVWLQTMPVENLAAKIGSHLIAGRSNPISSIIGRFMGGG